MVMHMVHHTGLHIAMSRYSSSAVVSDCVLTGCSEDNRCNEHSLSSFEDYCNEGTGDCICSTGYTGEFCEQSRCKCKLKVHCLFNKPLFTVLINSNFRNKLFCELIISRTSMAEPVTLFFYNFKMNDF